jgi:subtilisin family serine protease
VIKGKNTVENNFDPYDDNGHGTHVAGIIAAQAASGKYGEGVSTNSKILAIKVLNGSGDGTFFDIAQGMQYARTAVTSPTTRVLNMSLGGPNSLLVTHEVDAIKAAGKVLVAAAGNSNTTNTAFAFPGADPDTALRVMATDENDQRAFFSNFSPSSNPNQYNIAAPGYDIYSTFPEEGFGSLSGTSMASPVVAGTAALVWGRLPALTRDQLVSRVVDNGKLLGTANGFAAATRRVDVRRAYLGTSETAVVGRLLDPFTGKAASSNTSPSNARLFSGTNQLAVDGTNKAGTYEMSSDAGILRSLRGDRNGYVNALLRSGIII